jgi:hypothetical protein
MFEVKYRITGFPNEITAGPYSEKEAQSQRDDIAGFEGVEYAVIVPAKDAND